MKENNNKIRAQEDFDDILQIKNTQGYKRYLSRRLKEKAESALSRLLDPAITGDELTAIKFEYLIRKEYADMIENDLDDASKLLRGTAGKQRG